MQILFAPFRLGKLGGGIAQTCLVVIDGLCEAEVHRPDHGNTIASFLAKHLAKFPEWLKVKYFLAFLSILFRGDSTTLTLSTLATGCLHGALRSARPGHPTAPIPEDQSRQDGRGRAVE